MNRRFFCLGLIAAPLVCRIENLMPIRGIPLPFDPLAHQGIRNVWWGIGDTTFGREILARRALEVEFESNLFKINAFNQILKYGSPCLIL